jgi:mannitol/fructose-specific phosphotransferase system IIA component (Ntr-type)
VKIHEVLQRNGILIDFKPADKRDALVQMGQFLASLFDLKSPDMIVQRILERESEMSTGIGYGIAIPHARIDGLDRLHMIAARAPAGIDFDALDEQPVHLIFMMVSPTNTAADHTKILSSLTRVMSYEEIRTSLLEITDAGGFLETIVAGESKYVS